MISIEIMVAYSAACLLVIAAPGPDNLLVIGRGISQGRVAAAISSVGTSVGVMVHVLAATFGLTVLMQTSEVAFWLLKLVGAAYLIWLAIQTFRSKNMISFAPADRLGYWQIFSKGFLTNVLNPKVAIFILAFVPQFIAIDAGNVMMQSLVLGGWYAFLSLLLFTALGLFSTLLAGWLKAQPSIVNTLNYTAGGTFLTAGLSVALLDKQH